MRFFETKSIGSFYALCGAMLILNLVGASSSIGSVIASQDGDVIYNFVWPDLNNNDLIHDNIFFYSGVSTATGDPASVTGSLLDFSPPGGTQSVGNYFNITAQTFGALGVFTPQAGDSSVWVGFNDGGVKENGASFDTLFADFFVQFSDVQGEAGVLSGLQDIASNNPPTVLDAETSFEGGSIGFQFRDFIMSRVDTATNIDTGSLTLVHFGTGSSFATATAVQATPEPSIYLLMLTGLAVLGLVVRRKSAGFQS